LVRCYCFRAISVLEAKLEATGAKTSSILSAASRFMAGRT